VVLFEEVVRRGYAGQVTMVRLFLQPFRAAGRRQREATERYETEPGQQAQVDWGDFGRIWNRTSERWDRLFAFVFTLGYSRAQYLEFVSVCDLEHFLACHLGAFGALGIPGRLLYDNLKTAILGRDGEGTPILPERFGDFALAHGFTPTFCRPYRARTKGKVERGIGYVRQNFWVRVASEVAAGTLDLAGLNGRAQAWVTEVANVRVHGTHGEVVWARYQAEREQLGRLAGRPPYDTAYHTVRRVARDGRFSYRGVHYQVPLSQAFREVRVTERLTGELTVRDRAGTELAVSRVGRPGRPQPVRPSVASAPSRASAAPELPPRDLAIYEAVAQAAEAAAVARQAVAVGDAA
jgi:transposase